MSSSSFKELEDPIEDREEKIYVGGLNPPNLTVQEISRRLQNIPDIEIIPSETHSETNLEDDSSKSYVHITAISKNPPLKAVDIIAKLYNNVKWKGCRIKIEEAKPHFLERLKDEQKVRIEQQQQQQQQQQNVLDDIDGDGDDGDDEDKGISNIPRRLKIRKRYGQPAYYIDTQPWNIVPCNNNWSKFSMARKKLQKRADKHKQQFQQQNQNSMNNNKKATVHGNANASVATRPIHSNSNYYHRAIHMRFGDIDGTDDEMIISEREKEEEMESSVSDDDSDDNNSPTDTTTGGEEINCFSDDDNEDSLETGGKNMVNSSAATKKDTSYVWSDDDDDDDDDDSNEEEKGEKKESNNEGNEVNSMISSEDEEEIGGGGIESHNDDDDDDDVEEEEAEAEDDDSDQSSAPFPIQGSNNEQSPQRRRQPQLQEEGYMWSTSSSSSDSCSDDDDAEANRKNNVDNTDKHQPFMTAATPSSAMDEFAAGWSDSSSEGDVSDDDESKNDSKPGSQQQQQQQQTNVHTTGSVDLKEDVSTNMEILAGIFPELATTKTNRIGFIDDDGQDEESSLQQQGHSLPRNDGNANSMVLMPRFDPNDMTTHKFVLDDDNNKIKASNHDKDNGSNDEKIFDKTNADKNEDCDSVAESINDDKDNSKDGERQHQDEELAVASPEIQQQRQGQLYEEKKLEDVFREARTSRQQQQVQRKASQGPASTVTTGNKSSSSGGGGFSFGFFDSAAEGEEGVSAKTQEEESPAVGGGFTFGFSLPTPTCGDGDATIPATSSSAEIENKQEEEEEEDDDDERKPTIPTEASIGGIEGGSSNSNSNSNNNNNNKNRYRHRGMFMPNNIVDNIVESIFYGECNDVKNKILSNPDKFRNSMAVKSQWMKERQSLTIDWKRKRKYAQTRIQKRMKLR